MMSPKEYTMKNAIPKKEVPQFLDSLIEMGFEVIAPVKTEQGTNFSVLEKGSEVELEGRTKYPPKKFFMPDGETIFRYDLEKEKVKTENKVGKRILFGVRPCDVQGLMALDKVFLEKDPYYRKKRENTIIMALNCSESGENCFCQSMGTDRLQEGYDLLMSETKNNLVLEDSGERGKKFAKKFTKSNKEKIPKLKNKKKFDSKNIETRILKIFDSKKWEEVSKKCLSCGACNISCPTCYCFAIRDVPGYDGNAGERKRDWSFCMLKNFSRVAGDMFFRRDRTERCKQFVFHKLSYFKEREGVQLCVGCGRCVDVCPTNIDFFKETEKILEREK